MWTITLLDDPLNISIASSTTTNTTTASKSNDGVNKDTIVLLRQTRIALVTCSITDLLHENVDAITTIQQQSVARIALADYISRSITTKTWNHSYEISNNVVLRIEPLHRTTITNRRTILSSSIQQFNKKNMSKQYTSTLNAMTTPYILERTDVTVVSTKSDITSVTVTNDTYELHMYVRVFVYTSPLEGDIKFDDNSIKQSISDCMDELIDFTTTSDNSMMGSFMTHISMAVLQEKLRSTIKNHTTINGAVAFIANGAILPRKSGASNAPMSCPPAIPFMAPENSVMNQSIDIDMGVLTKYIVHILPPESKINNTVITLSGLLVLRGVTLIVGGGYHGKSTLLRCIASGVYNKIPKDGREFCVTVDDAVTVRAEDGRYVKNCNVSAFISNLPTTDLDTKHFSTTEASGSTSQASNVVEAIEMGVSAMLVDEDVSAANFMARDGRMRSLVMDESITPLLYRVNGLFRTHGISSIVVVGGVGDWLDVPDNVILMDRYVCHDATAKARSISKQFSHGHVQYAGRGVVHRLNWEKSGTPVPRRPTFSTNSNECKTSIYDITKTSVTLLDGSNSIAVRSLSQLEPNCNVSDEMCIYDDTDDDEQYIDMSRCEQLLGKKPQLYGCGLCVAWLLNYSQQHPELGLHDLLQKMDDTLDRRGWLGTIQGSDQYRAGASPTWTAVVENLGFVYRPRRFEVGQALTRFRGISFENIPVEDDGSDEAAKIEAERQRNELLEIWNNRRKKNPE
jgi:predicted ABC-class ATPase